MAGRLGEADLARMRRAGHRGARRPSRAWPSSTRALAAGRAAGSLALPLDRGGAARRGRGGRPAAAPRAAGRGPGRRRRQPVGLARASASPPCPRPSARRRAASWSAPRPPPSSATPRPRRSRPTRLQGPRLRLAGGGRAAQPPRARDRPALPATLVFDHPSPLPLAELPARARRARAPAPAPSPSAPSASEEPIAIVGMGCRYPRRRRLPRASSGSWSPRAATRSPRFPADRGWDLERLYDPDPERPGTSYVREGGFLDDAAEFDAEFFGISPREATGDGPAAAAAAGSSWEALEDAGIDPASLRGSRDRRLRRRRCTRTTAAARPRAELEGYSRPGPTSVASGRIAYTLGLEGPAMTVDTACSSSLVAMHLAAQALRGGECDLALAGGVDRAADARRLRRVQPPARPRPRRALQVLRRGRRRHRLVGGRRHARARAPLRRRAQTATGSWP